METTAGLRLPTVLVAFAEDCPRVGLAAGHASVIAVGEPQRDTDGDTRDT